MDPYDWSVDRVIAEVAAGDKTLATSLRINEVDGEVLLTACTYERLKDDIGIISLGKRSKMVRAIEGLKKKSKKYMDHIQDLASNTALPDDVGSVFEYSPPPPGGIRSLDIPYFPIPSGSRKRKNRIVSAPLMSPLGSSTAPELPLPETTLGGGQKRRKPLSLLAAADENLPLFVSWSAMHLTSHSAVRIVRNRKTGVVDTVPFSQETASSGSPSVDGMDFDMDMGVDHDPGQPSSPLAGRSIRIENRDGGNIRVNMLPEASVAGYQEGGEDDVYGRNRNIRKDLVATADDDRPVHLEISKKDGELVFNPRHSNKASVAARKHRYLPVKGLSVDEIMYGKTDVGCELLDEEDDREFCTGNGLCPKANKEFALGQFCTTLKLYLAVSESSQKNNTEWSKRRFCSLVEYILTCIV